VSQFHGRSLLPALGQGLSNPKIFCGIAGP
jgi:hypothetical protein